MRCGQKRYSHNLTRHTTGQNSFDAGEAPYLKPATKFT